MMNTQSFSRKHFDVLTHLERFGQQTQRNIAEATGMSVGSVNRIISTLTEQGYIADGMITEAGLQALEPYRVKRAIFIAAGFGHRLVPITLNTPKPLVRVKGTRMIDTLLDAVLAAGIEEIYVVRGYLGEQFDQLLYKYPMIHFIDNPYYNDAENIYSVLCARHLLQNAYVLESDLVLHNPNLITTYQYSSNYLGVDTNMTDDWCFDVKNRRITGIQVGGVNCVHMFGISYWTEEDGAKLSEDIQRVYEMPGGKQRYWDQVPLEYCKDRYQVEVRYCSFGDISEVDSVSDLRAVDPLYGIG
jgi:CTP:phosphocholine cytidylyltransferase-like protein